METDDIRGNKLVSNDNNNSFKLPLSPPEDTDYDDITKQGQERDLL